MSGERRAHHPPRRLPGQRRALIRGLARSFLARADCDFAQPAGAGTRVIPDAGAAVQPRRRSGTQRDERRSRHSSSPGTFERFARDSRWVTARRFPGLAAGSLGRDDSGARGGLPASEPGSAKPQSPQATKRPVAARIGTRRARREPAMCAATGTSPCRAAAIGPRSRHPADQPEPGGKDAVYA